MEKNKIILVVGASADHFGAYSENCEGIYGGGDTPQAAINEAMEGLRLLNAAIPEERWDEVLREKYEFVYKYDVQSLLNYYMSLFKAPALGRVMGINEKQLHHYASGLKHPRPAQKQKIINGLHRLGRELIAAEL